MFLIEYDKGLYINGELVDWMQVNSVGKVSVTLSGDTETIDTVNPDCAATFVNNMQALSGSGGVEACYHEIINNPQPNQT